MNGGARIITLPQTHIGSVDPDVLKIAKMPQPED